MPSNIYFPSPIGKLQYYLFCQAWGHRWDPNYRQYHKSRCRICRGILSW